MGRCVFAFIRKKEQHFYKVLSRVSDTEHIPQKLKGDNIMEHTKANKSKILALILGLTMCISLMLGIVFAKIGRAHV